MKFKKILLICLIFEFNNHFYVGNKNSCIAYPLKCSCSLLLKNNGTNFDTMYELLHRAIS